jgi:hypothetical protein
LGDSYTFIDFKKERENRFRTYFFKFSDYSGSEHVGRKVARSVGHADDRLINQSIIYAANLKLAIQFVSFSLLSFILGPNNTFYFSS